MTWKDEVASAVTSGRSSKRGATRGGTLAEARDAFLPISGLTGEVLPLVSDLGLISTWSEDGLTFSDGEEERLVLMREADKVGELRLLRESSSLTAVTGADPKS